MSVLSLGSHGTIKPNLHVTTQHGLGSALDGVDLGVGQSHGVKCNWGHVIRVRSRLFFHVQGAFGLLACFWGMVLIFRGLDAMFAMRSAWVLAMLTVTALALLPVGHLQLPVFDGWDKAQHTLAFAVLTAWALWIWPVSVPRVLLGMLAYGAGLELAQWAVGWRFADWADLAADSWGQIPNIHE